IQLLGINRDGPAGILPPGYHGQITLEFTAVDTQITVPYRLDLFVVDAPDDPVNWDDFKSAFQPPDIPSDAWDAIYANFTSRVGTTFGQYQAVLDDDTTYLSQLRAGAIGDVARLVGFELRRANSGGPLAPFDEDPDVPLTDLLPQLGDDLDLYQRTLATEAYLAPSFATDQVIPGAGINLSFGRVYAQTIAGRYGQGALGRGWTSSWDISARLDTAGNVTIRTPAGERPSRIQPDGSFQASPGDPATLTLAAGEYDMHTTDGHTLAFFGDGRLKYVQDSHGNRITAAYTGGRLTSLAHSDGDTLQIGY